MKKKLQLFSKSRKKNPNDVENTEVFSAKTNLNSTPGSGTLKRKRAGGDLRPRLRLYFLTIVRVSGGRRLLNGRCDFAAMDDP